MRMPRLSKSDFTKNSKGPSLEEDEADNGYQKDTQENNVTKVSNANDGMNVLECESAVILATLLRYVQKPTSHISLNFETVALLSMFVRLDSEICSVSNSNERIKCLGFCGTRRQIFFRSVSCVVIMRLPPQIRISGVPLFFVVCART